MKYLHRTIPLGHNADSPSTTTTTTTTTTTRKRKLYHGSGELVYGNSKTPRFSLHFYATYKHENITTIKHRKAARPPPARNITPCCCWASCQVRAHISWPDLFPSSPWSTATRRAARRERPAQVATDTRPHRCARQNKRLVCRIWVTRGKTAAKKRPRSASRINSPLLSARRSPFDRGVTFDDAKSGVLGG